VNLYWTHKNHFCGLKHFILINEIEIKKKYFVQLVSVLDADINLTISKKELENSNEWKIGWEEVSEIDSIIDEYHILKSQFKAVTHKKLFIEESSPFNIS